MDERPPRFLHGSPHAFEAGTVLRGRGETYAEEWSGTGFYAALERWRPPGSLAQRDAMFMVGNIEDLGLAGGSLEWCLEVEPMGPVSRHDLNWTGVIAMHLEEGGEVDDPEVEAAAKAYWSGEPSPNERVWEYLVPSFRVLRCDLPDEFDDDDDAPPPGLR